MQPQRSPSTVLRVMALHTIELISLLCTLHWIAPSLLMPTLLSPLTFVADRQSELVQAQDLRPELWAIALALNSTLYLLLKSQVTLMVRELQSQPLSTVDWKPLLLVLPLALVQLALLVVMVRIIT